MNFKGIYGFAKSRDDIWCLMNDPAFLKEIVPGCHCFEKIDDNQYNIKAILRYGFVKLPVNAVLKVDPVAPPQHYILQATADTWGGKATGYMNICLHAMDAGCAFEYDVTLNLEGGLAKIGEQVVSMTAENLSGQFFDHLAEKMTTRIIPVPPHLMAMGKD